MSEQSERKGPRAPEAKLGWRNSGGETRVGEKYLSNSYPFMSAYTVNATLNILKIHHMVIKKYEFLSFSK